MARWTWTLGLAAAVLGVGAGLGFVLEGASSSAALNLALAATVLGVAWAGLRREELLAWLGLPDTTRRLARGLTTGLALALSVALVALATRHDRTWDLSTTGRNTLSHQTVQVIEAIEVPVTLTTFATSLAPGREPVARLLDRAKEHSDLLTVEFIDPIAAPGRARAAGITGEHTIVLIEAAGRPPVRLDGTLTEDDLVGGLIEATSQTLHVVCWTVDHGEADPDDESSATGLGGVRTALERLNYQVMLTRLVAEGIDEACEVVVVARPVLTLSDVAVARLDAWILAGGQLFVLLEPDQSPALARWLGRYGVAAPPFPIVTPRPLDQLAGADPTALWLPSEVAHPITADLDGFSFSGARPVDPIYDVEGVEVQGLVWTDDGARLVDPSGRLTDNPGPFSVVTATRVDDPRVLGPLLTDAPPPTLRAGGRIVVAGDADFASRRGAQIANNTDLFLNAIAWLVREPAQVGARSAPAETLRLTEGALTLQGVLFVLILPLGAAVAAVVVLARRRYL